jgi:hypothetical protein
MAAIGKVLVLMTLLVGLAILTWSTSIYVERPGWFDPASEGIDKGNKPVGFAQLKAETDALARTASAASEAWGSHLKALEEREKFRDGRRAAYAERIRWAHKGNPNDKIDPANPKSPGKGFYEPVVDPATKLYDLTLVGGIPKGKAILATDGTPLPGRDGLLDSLAGDVAEIQNLNAQIMAERKNYDKLSTEVIATEVRLIKMNEIRDRVQNEMFFLSTFEVNVYETRETVFRRERQLRDRLRILGITDP